MSGPEDTPPEPTRDDPMIAAEWALGLLEGEELRAARSKYAADPAFAWRKEWWDNWFAPWTDEMAGAAEPGAHVWDGIVARIGAQRGETAPAAAMLGEVVELKARLRRWQWTAGVTSAAAAVALAVLAFTPGTTPRVPGDDAPLQAAAAPLVATVPLGETGLRLDVTYIPESGKILVAAIGLTPDGVHDHELWLVPDDGAAKSLGVIVPGTVRAISLPQEIVSALHDGSRVLLTREPLGGKPADARPGPVVAEGAFTRV